MSVMKVARTGASVTLVGSEYRADTQGLNLRVRVLQQFRVPDTNPAPEDLSYSFSVPHGAGKDQQQAQATLTAVRIVADDKVIDGKVLPIQEAETKFAAARAAGKGAAIVKPTDSKDVFRTTVAAVLPGTLVSVCLTLMVPMRFEGKTIVGVVPIALAARFGASAPTPGSAPSPLFSDAWDAVESSGEAAVSPGGRGTSCEPCHPSRSVATATVKVEMRVDLGRPLAAVACPSHRADPLFACAQDTDPDGSIMRATLTLGSGMAGVSAAEDFVVVITPRDVNQPLVCVEHRPACEEEGVPACTAIEVAVHMDLVPEGGLAPPTAPGLYWFVVDLSGSMDPCIGQAREAAMGLIASVPQGSLVQMTFFGELFKHVFSAPTLYTWASADALKAAVKFMTANMGGTDMRLVLEEVMGQVREGATAAAHLPVRCILITDGSVDADIQRACCDIVSATVAGVLDVRVFTVGVGHEVSTALVNGLAAAGRGRAVFANADNISACCQRVFTAAAGGALTDVHVKWSKALEDRVLPGCGRGYDPLPVVYNAETVTFSAIFENVCVPSADDDDAWVTVQATRAGPCAGVGYDAVPMSWTMRLNGVAATTGRELHAHVAGHVIGRLLEVAAQTPCDHATRQALKDRAVELACTFGVVSAEGTAFLAVWDRKSASDTASAATAVCSGAVHHFAAETSTSSSSHGVCYPGPAMCTYTCAGPVPEPAVARASPKSEWGSQTAKGLDRGPGEEHVVLRTKGVARDVPPSNLPLKATERKAPEEYREIPARGMGFAPAFVPYIMGQQDFEGFWELQHVVHAPMLCYGARKGIESLRGAGLPVSDAVWATFVVLQILRDFCSLAEKQWSLVAAEAHRWLCAQAEGPRLLGDAALADQLRAAISTQ